MLTNLERAKNGDKNAYSMLCGELADGLYSVALFTLDNKDDAETVVKNAFSDGYSSIKHIKDKDHLCAWLSRELTKHIVSKIKEYRSKGIENNENKNFAQLSSLDKLTSSLKYAFGYNVHEIALITGLKDETVERKISDAEKKLGENKYAVINDIKSIKAPQALLFTEVPKAPEKDITFSEVSSEHKTEINARTFIGVITAQKIKGSEFLQLMGNTRISNEAYHEIEQNQNLTKERLIELLENSSLTSDDYYKLLTAVKRRSELITKKQEADRLRELEAEEAGLFLVGKKINKERHEEKSGSESDTHKTEAILSAINKDIAEPSEENDDFIETVPSSVSENRTGPFTPVVDTAILDILSFENGEEEDEEDEDIPPAKPAFIKKKKKEQEKISPAPVITVEPVRTAEAVIAEAVPSPSEEDKASEPDRREKYKGEEFFFDDDAYYEGVNNGKIIFCAVCAVILFGLSFGIRWLTTGSFLPDAITEENTPETEQPTEIIEEISSDEDISAVIGSLKTRIQHNETEYYKTDAVPYSCPLASDFLETENYFYIHNKGVIRAVALTDEPHTAAEYVIPEDYSLIGFAASGESFYTVCSAKNSENDRKHVFVTAFSPELTVTEEYAQDGSFVNINVKESSFTLITSLNSSEDEDKLPSYKLNGSENRLGFSDISVTEKAVCNNITVVGTVSGGEARVNAVIGGYESYAVFEGEGFTLLLPDWNSTHIETYRLIGSAAELVSAETVRGECLGAQFRTNDGSRLVTYNSADGCTIVYKKNGDEYSSLEGFGAGERLTGVSFTDKLVYMVTRSEDNSAKLYCADTSGAEPLAVEADPAAVYTEKLSARSDTELIGLSASADENGKRTGLRLSVYGYSDKLSELRYTEITVDEKTAPEYSVYLSGDAEENSRRISVNGDLIALSCVYFDGISEIERFLCFRDNGTAFETAADIFLFDIQSDYRYVTLRGKTLYIITDSSIVLADTETGNTIDYFSE